MTTIERDEEQKSPDVHAPMPATPMPSERQPDEGDFADEAGPRETEFARKKTSR